MDQPRNAWTDWFIMIVCWIDPLFDASTYCLVNWSTIWWIQWWFGKLIRYSMYPLMVWLNERLIDSWLIARLADCRRNRRPYPFSAPPFQQPLRGLRESEQLSEQMRPSVSLRLPPPLRNLRSQQDFWAFPELYAAALPPCFWVIVFSVSRMIRDKAPRCAAAFRTWQSERVISLWVAVFSNIENTDFISFTLFLTERAVFGLVITMIKYPLIEARCAHVRSDCH